MNPLDYSLCTDTVTVYRKESEGVFRQVLDNCFLSWEEQVVTDKFGTRKGVEFLLICPGDTQKIFPGDRIYAGVGPEAEEVQWGEFLPAAVPGLGQVSYVRVYRLDGENCHTEAGSRQPVRPQL